MQATSNRRSPRRRGHRPGHDDRAARARRRRRAVRRRRAAALLGLLSLVLALAAVTVRHWPWPAAGTDLPAPQLTGAVEGARVAGDQQAATGEARGTVVREQLPGGRKRPAWASVSVDSGGISAETDAMAVGTGEFRIMPAFGEPAPAGTPLRYAVEVEQGLPVDAERFTRFVDETLADERSWAAMSDRVAVRVGEQGAGGVGFRVVLASAATTDRLCAPLQTLQTWSCFMNGRAVINFRRWVAGVEHYPPDQLEGYRRYVVNHEVGHALGYDHVDCPGEGKPAPVMMQQSKSLGACVANWWPKVA